MSQLMTLDSFTKDLALHQRSFESVLPAHIPAKKFMRTVVGAVQNNPDILAADKQSILLSCQKAAQDGLILDGREAALVVYNTKVNNQWVKKAQYQPMIDGILKKARNSGEISMINAIVVKKNDPFKYNPAMDELPNHNPDWFGDRGDMVGVYAFAHLKDGSKAVEIMSLAEVEQIRRVSKSGNDDNGNPKGIWKDWYDQKAKVACLKRLCRRLPSSADLEQVLDRDNADYEAQDETVIEEKDINIDKPPAPKERRRQTKAA